MNWFRKKRLQKEGGIVPRSKLIARKIVDGKYSDIRRVIENKCITTAFVNDIVDCLTANGTQLALFDDYKYHDSGIGTGAELVGNTGLGTAWGGARSVGSQAEGTAANIYSSVATTTYNNTFAITEHGLFNGTASGQMMDRTLFSAINVASGNQIEWTYTVTFAAGG